MTSAGHAGYVKAYEVLRVAKKYRTVASKKKIVDHDFGDLPDPDDFDYSA